MSTFIKRAYNLSRMAILISHFVFSFSLMGLVKSQASSTRSESACGYINGDVDRALNCSSGSCGFLLVQGHSKIYAGCCDGRNCVVPTTCIESGTASNDYTVECTDDSLPACATYTWADLLAERYFCAPSRTIVTVVTETSSDSETSSAIEPSTTAAPTDAGSAPPKPTATATEPANGGGPNLGTEHDLSSRQRIGAGVGSGVSGGLLLIFFAIFGCCKWPSQRTKTTRKQHVPERIVQKAAPTVTLQADSS